MTDFNLGIVEYSTVQRVFDNMKVVTLKAHRRANRTPEPLGPHDFEDRAQHQPSSSMHHEIF